MWAPHRDSGARGALLGLTAGVSRAHVVRAIVESMALRTRDMVEAMEAAGARFDELHLLGIPAARASTAGTTALGATCHAALARMRSAHG